MSAHPPNGIVWAPLRLEAWALRLGAPGLPVVRCGMGPGRAEAAARSRASELGAWLVLGLCGATDPRLRVGDVFVPDAVRLPEGGERRLAAASLRATLADAGFAVADGLLASADHVVRGSERAAFHASGVRAVDMESAWLAKHAGDRDLAVVRVVVDAPAQELREAGFPLRAWRGLSALRRLAPLISNWMGSHALPVTPLPAVR